jgi:hypothetical protein
MNEDGEFIIVVYLIHGEPIKCKVQPSAAEMLAKKEDIENALSRVSMALDIDGKLLIIPYSNIKYIEATPTPPNLPLFITQRATPIP